MRIFYIAFEVRQRAEKRRQALTAAGCSTYEMQNQGTDRSIICLCCGLQSWNWGDVENRYCGFCHQFHTMERPHDEDAGRSNTNESRDAAAGSP